MLRKSGFRCAVVREGCSLLALPFYECPSFSYPFPSPLVVAIYDYTKDKEDELFQEGAIIYDHQEE